MEYKDYYIKIGFTKNAYAKQAKHLYRRPAWKAHLVENLLNKATEEQFNPINSKSDNNLQFRGGIDEGVAILLNEVNFPTVPSPQNNFNLNETRNNHTSHSEVRGFSTF